ncbi:ChbG/HpnK family deacetylase [Thermomonas sp.]|uniref:carbohydrate deacetylase n=1 Tax=Thermomonas sp. TaxID=1971895 RepID=UPI0026332E02|nr:ChbG/HpnK family deacetylase [Thermomonas sp.]MCO5054638.1 ChbG/HpnK family deacetylase [Thermomonas sp.]
MNPRLLIVNADDFGLVPAATDAILECHAAGTVTSTTLMANTPDAERAAGCAKQVPKLGVGLHFNLTWGRPLASVQEVSALVGSDGAFFSRGRLARRLLAGRVPAVQIAAELQAQLQRLDELGIQPTHIDSHQHVHGFGPVFDAIAQHCSRVGIPMRVPWVAADRNAGMGRRLRRALLAVMLARSTRRWRGQVRWNDAIGSVFDLGGGAREYGDVDYQQVVLQGQGQTFELMVHPVNDAQAMEGYTRVGTVGQAEWKYLRTGALRALARDNGFALGSYRDIGGQNG